MGFIKVTKNKAYFKRFQTKFRRRREGKTDYHARRAMIVQDQDKYNVPKYRFVVRFTKSRVLVQVCYATIAGDRVLCEANSTELPRYGVKIGLTNYSAAYCTGLLLARRLLKQLGTDKMFTGVDEVTGEDEDTWDEDDEDAERRPFKCILDIGLVRTTTGNRVFGAMKGALDGGLNIPHSNKRFPGYDRESDSYNAEVHRARIFGGHVKDYMKHLQEENPDKYETHFSQYIKLGLSPDDIEPMYLKCHEAIRANPDRVKKVREHAPVCVREGDMIRTSKAVYPRKKKLTSAQRKERVARKIGLVMERRMAADDEE